MISRREARNAALGIGLTSNAQVKELAPANPKSASLDSTPGGHPQNRSAMASPDTRPRVVAGAVGAVSRTLDQFNQDMQAAKDLVASGGKVVELDTSAIEDSILKDRLEVDPETQASLIESIRQSGQQVPILVRQVGEAPTRYQVAYGHRRLAACRHLGRKILAIVRSLTDQELLVAQGQENSSRTDLSYIERALFALNLETRGINRDAIMLALSTDKTEVSKMISVARSVPADIVRSIGPAPKAGRTRWLGLSERLSGIKLDAKFQVMIGGADFASATSDARFERVFKFLQAKPKHGASSEICAPLGGKQIVRVTRSPKAMTLTIDQQLEPGFGDFLLKNLEAFYETFQSQKNAQR